MFVLVSNCMPDNSTQLQSRTISPCVATCISDVISKTVKEEGRPIGLLSLLLDTKDISKIEQTQAKQFDDYLDQSKERKLTFYLISHKDNNIRITSGSGTSEVGGQILAEIFHRPFLGVPEKISAFPPKMLIYLPKFLMTFFTSIQGGAKILIFRQIHNAIIALSAPEGGQTPLSTSMRGPWPDLPPPQDPPLVVTM